MRPLLKNIAGRMLDIREKVVEVFRWIRVSKLS
jgi:hypothetical protein